jgi:PAS domain-containing protein
VTRVGGAPELTNPSHQKVIPPAVARPSIAHSVPVAPNNGHLHPHIPSSNSAATFTNGNMRPPASPAALSSSQTSSVGASDDVASVQNKSVAGAGGRILPHLEAALPSSASSVASSSFSSGGYGGDGKKQMKRAANRKSAQLSRKRKKVFMEELKEENDELRRKEQILRAIPDLIVVFDSSGKLGFVSESVSRFFDIAQEDLEGTSFWDRLCDDSVRLLKAAFMDSLAARKLDSDTAPLGSGVWELRLVDKKSNYMIVTLNGVVHFTGEAPECVCCIRPREEPLVQTVSGNSGAALNKDGVISSNSSTSKQGHVKAGSKRTVSSDDYSQGSDSSSGVIPSQSVMVRSGLSADDDVSAEQRKQLGRHMGGVPGDGLHRSGQVVRISDGDSVEAVSESCSDDGVASN